MSPVEFKSSYINEHNRSYIDLPFNKDDHVSISTTMKKRKAVNKGMRIKNRIVCKLFRLIWYKWLYDAEVVAVKGWRTCVRDMEDGDRSTITICLFPWD